MNDLNALPPKQQESEQISERHGPRPRWVWGLLLLALAAMGGYLYFRSPGTTTAPPAQGGRRGGAGAGAPVPVVAATARSGDIPIYLNGLGAVTPLATVTITTHVDGELTKVLFAEGQVVKKGQLIAQIDPRPYQVQLEQAEAQMAHDQALLKNAQVDLERYQTLFKQDSIAQQTLATQEALVRQYVAQLKIDQSQIDSAKLNLSYCSITAPVAGRVGLRLVDPGNIVHAAAATGIVVITQLQPISVVFSIAEDNIPAVMRKLQGGAKMPVTAFDRSQKNRLADGSLLTVDNQIDPTTGMVKLKAQFGNDDYNLFPSQFVNAQLLIDTRRDVVLLPTAGVQHGSQGAYVYVVAQGVAHLRVVKVGQTSGDTTAISDGLAAGEMVVVDGTDKLREGAKVAVTLAGAKGAATPTHRKAPSAPPAAPTPSGGRTRSGA